MSKLLDPTACPDCRSTLTPDQICTGCGLVLSGPPAVALWRHLTAADALVDQLRATPAPASPPPPPPPPSPPPHPYAPYPAFSGRTSERHRVSSLSAQVLLLSVGGLCLFVAAAVFVAVTWSSLGLTGRTLVMTGLTGAVAAVAATLTRRGLRGGAETLWLLTAALVSIDVLAARGAGLRGDLPLRHVGTLLGLALVALGIGAAAVGARRSLVLVGPVLTAAAGALLIAGGEAWTAPHPAAASTAAVLVATGVGLALRLAANAGTRRTGLAISGTAAASWLVVVLDGLRRTGPAEQWWHGLNGWPLLAAAVLAAAPAVRRATTDPWRSLCAAASVLTATGFVLGGNASSNPEVVLLSGVLLSLAVVTAAAPVIWARPAGALVALGCTAALLTTAARVVVSVTQLEAAGPGRDSGLSTRLLASTAGVATWTAPLVTVVGVVALAALARHLSENERREALAGWFVLAPTAVALGAVIALLEDRPQLGWAAAALGAVAALAVAIAGAARRTGIAPTVGVAAAYVVVALELRLVVPSHLLTALVATLAALVVAGATRGRTIALERTLAGLLGATVVALAGAAAVSWSLVTGAGSDGASLTLALTAAVLALGAVALSRNAATRATIEATAVVVAALAAALPADLTIAAVDLTVAGSAAALVAVLHADRETYAWLGTALLALATAIRLTEGVAAPEVYVLPAAVVLLAAGVRRLLVDHEVTSWQALGSGLSLGLVPSLLLTLDDPVSLRGAVLAGAGLLVLAVGTVRRWGAPFVAGASVVAILALVHLGPVAAALPRWISLGSVGVLLLVVGVTWEARRRDSATAQRYLLALR